MSAAPALDALAARLAARADAGEFLSPAWTARLVVEAVEDGDARAEWALVREPRDGAPALVGARLTFAEAVDGLVKSGAGYGVYSMTIGHGPRSCAPDEWSMEDALRAGQEPSVYWTEVETEAGAVVPTVTVL